MIKNILLAGVGILAGIIIADMLIEKKDQEIDEEMETISDEEVEEMLSEETKQALDNLKRDLRTRIIFDCIIRFILLSGIPLLMLMSYIKKQRQIDKQVLCIMERGCANQC